MFLCFGRRRFQDATGHKYKQEPPRPPNVGGNVFFVVVTDVWPTAHSFHLLANKLSIGASVASTSPPPRVVERHVGGELIWRKGLFARK